MNTTVLNTWMRLTLFGLGMLALPFRAQAFYNPQNGRWLNRDPLVLSQGRAENYLGAYTFTQNSPVQSFDILGLLTDEERKNACREAWKEDQAREPKDRRFNGYAQTICVGKEPIGCVWEDKTKGWAPQMIACAQSHEDSHVKDVGAIQPPFGCSANAHCSEHWSGDAKCVKCSKYYPPMIGDIKLARDSECTAWKATFDCMAKHANANPKPNGWAELEKQLTKAAKDCPNQFPRGVIVWPK